MGTLIAAAEYAECIRDVNTFVRPASPHAPLDICPYRNTMSDMARSSTTADVFNAVAEGRRREILDTLIGTEKAVGTIVKDLSMSQPQVSKHLRVLTEVGLVSWRPDGRRRLYSLG